ncbi:MAG: DMT family transporter [Microscillaceae bacterium]|nr:DMT family transporter [Microscillaceae bacterium]MDW8460615.1 DMT family transporter [Cytophagales bacterium]
MSVTIIKQHNRQQKNIIAWGLLLLLALVWGTSFFLVKQGLTVLTPIQVAGLRISAAFVAVLPWAIIHVQKVERAQLKFIFMSGMLGMLLPAILFSIAQQHIISSVAGVLNALTPAFTVLIAFLFFQQKVHLEQVIGLGLGLLGSVSLAFQQAPAQSQGVTFNAYALLIIAATLMYATNANLLSSKLRNIKPFYLSTLSISLIGPLALVLLFASDIEKNINQPNSLIPILAIIFLGLVSTALATVLFNYLLQMTSVVFASSVTYLIPLVAVFWGLVDGEKLLLWHFVGIICIILGVYLVNRRK